MWYFNLHLEKKILNILLGNLMSNILHVKITGEWILDKEDAHYGLLDHIMDFPIDSLYSCDGLDLMVDHRVKGESDLNSTYCMNTSIK